ncbi:MAG: glycoside hydrolase family 28 protein [Bacteroidota bacterium]|nr:glycoside hydrolase family 28 protein [Bacteroidota bacterium]
MKNSKLIIFLVGMYFTALPAMHAQAQQAEMIKQEIVQLVSGAPFTMPAVAVPSFAGRSFNINDYGAAADGKTLNTKAMNDAIQACSNAGGGTVIVPPGLWFTGPIKIGSNVNLHLERGALIQFSKNIDDYPLIAGLSGKSKHYIRTPPLYSYKAKNIAITGYGIIDGAGEAWRYAKKSKFTATQWKEQVASGGYVSPDGKEWWPSKEAYEGEAYLSGLEKSGMQPTRDDFEHVREFLRPDLVVFDQCSGVLIDGTTFENSPKFHVRPSHSENIIIRNVKVFSPWYGQNNDGIDPTSCRNLIMYNCILDVGDDGICLKPASLASSQTPGPACENILIADCAVYHAHGGFVIGSESYGGVNNVFVNNCVYVGTDVGLRFKSLRGKGGLVQNVFVDGIQMRGIATDAILFDMYYGGGSPDVEAEKQDDTHHAEPVNERTPRFQNFSIKNIACLGAARAMDVKGLAEMPVKNIFLENVSIESEKGVFLTQADGVTFRNVTITLRTGAVISLDESRNITIDGMKYPAGAERFLSVEGETSEAIRVSGVDVSLAKKGIEIGKDVPAHAITMKR